LSNLTCSVCGRTFKHSPAYGKHVKAQKCKPPIFPAFQESASSSNPDLGSGNLLDLDQEDPVATEGAMAERESNEEEDEEQEEERPRIEFETPSPIISRIRDKFKCPITQKEYDAIKFVPGEPIIAEKSPSSSLISLSFFSQKKSYDKI